MNMISQTHLRWVRAMAVIVALTPYLTGCNSSDASALQDSPATTVAAATTSTAAAISTAAATLSTAAAISSTTDNAPPSAAPASTNSTTSVTTSRRYSLVSSSGQVVDASDINQNSSLSFGSTGAAGRPEADGADMTPLSTAELEAMKTTTTPAARIIQESVLGFDSRFQVNPYTYPQRAVALITYNGATHCTGWLVSKDTLVTAGHCVHGGGSTGRWGTLSAFKIYPGFSDDYAPYGSCTPKEIYSSSGWITVADTDSDIGIIKLDCEVGNSTGYFSYFVADPVENVAITINGYPGDKAEGHQQWASTGTISHATAAKLYYDNDTTGGMSGSPIWVQNANGTAWSFGIHTNGESILLPNTNAGTRISQDVFDLITAVKELP